MHLQTFSVVPFSSTFNKELKGSTKFRKSFDFEYRLPGYMSGRHVAPVGCVRNSCMVCSAVSSLMEILVSVQEPLKLDLYVGIPCSEATLSN